MAEEEVVTPPVEEVGDNIVDSANEAAERLERANAETLKLVERQEKMMVEKTLGGHTTTEGKTKELTQEEKEIANARSFLKGTGYEDIEL